MSKNFLAIVAAMFVAGAAVAATVTNYLQQVVTVDANGVVTSIVINDGGATNLPRSLVSLSGIQVSTSTNATPGTSYTARDIGDLLFFPNSTNAPALFIATAATATNWSRITTAAP